MASTIIPLGTAVHLTCDFKNSAAALADPDTVELRIKEPSGTTITKTLADNEVQPLTTGKFYFDYLPTEAGEHYYAWVGASSDLTGVNAATDGGFQMKALSA